MYNPNKEIRDRVFPVKIGKFSVKYFTFWLNSVVELYSSSKKTTNLYIAKESWKGIF